MADPRISLRDPWFSLLLAFVLPGLGHLYQRRYFKSAIFFVAIMGLFCWGMGTAEGKPVYYRPIWGPDAGERKEGIGYLAQIGVGLPALPAYFQYRRYKTIENLGRDRINTPIEATFTGQIDVDRTNSNDTLFANVTGNLSLQAGSDQLDSFGRQESLGQFSGQTDDGEQIDVALGPVRRIDPEIDADPRRTLTAIIIDTTGREIGEMTGSIPRPFWDYYQVPLSQEIEERVNGQLGTQFELAYVLVMIAGMLNLLVAYDAFEGPAYGYDFEAHEQKQKSTA